MGAYVMLHADSPDQLEELTAAVTSVLTVVNVSRDYRQPHQPGVRRFLTLATPTTVSATVSSRDHE